MPELPEVETMMRDLDQKIRGLSVVKTQVLDDLREKASFVFAHEITVRFFKYFLKGNILSIRKVEVSNYNMMFSNHSSLKNEIKH